MVLKRLSCADVYGMQLLCVQVQFFACNVVYPITVFVLQRVHILALRSAPFYATYLVPLLAIFTSAVSVIFRPDIFARFVSGWGLFVLVSNVPAPYDTGC